MKALPIEAKLGKDGKPEKIELNLGESIAELVTQYGEEIVYNHAKASITVAAQSKMRNLMDPERDGGPLSGAALQAEMEKWKPGIRKPGKPVHEKVKDMWTKMDPELRRKLLAELQGGGDGPDTEEEVEEELEQEEAQEEEEQQNQRASAGNRRRK